MNDVADAFAERVEELLYRDLSTILHEHGIGMLSRLSCWHRGTDLAGVVLDL